MARALKDREKEIVIKEKRLVQTYLGKNFTVYEPVLIKVQVANGSNFLVKILVDNDEYIHVKMNIPPLYSGLDGEAKLIFVHTGKTFDDKL
jgi:hypothetical protein